MVPWTLFFRWLIAPPWRVVKALGTAIARSLREDATHLAGYLAFTGLLALFPFLLSLAALGGTLGAGIRPEVAIQALFNMLPPDVATTLAPAVRQVLQSGSRSSLLTAGIVVTLWSAGNGIAALRVALNQVYGAVERRNFLVLIGLHLGLVICAAVATLGLSFAIILGPLLWKTIVAPLAPKMLSRALWDFARYGAGLALIVGILVMMHRILPARHLRFRVILPGVLLNTVTWLLLASLFSLFLSQAGNYDVTYGSLGSVVIVLIFFYLSAALLLIGAHFNVAYSKLEPVPPPVPGAGGLSFGAINRYMRSRRAKRRGSLPMTQPQDQLHVTFPGRVVMIGFGSIGQGVLPLVLRHIGLDKAKLTIISADQYGREEAEAFGVDFSVQTLTPDNYRQILEPLVGPGDFLLNLSVDVASLALIEFANSRGALYLDTCIEPWAGGYTDPGLSPSGRSNYALREAALALRARLGPGPTAVVTHGANPGHVSHLVKQALLDIAAATGTPAAVPTERAGWAALARQLGVKVIHIAERDTQVSATPKAVGEFVNTWSIDGFAGEGCQPAELGWGVHEKQLPADGARHDFGSDAAIYLLRPGASVKVRSWTPLEGPYHGFLITHNEAISLTDFLTVHDGDKVLYRPTCHYAYHPCDDAVLSVHEMAGKNWQVQANQRLMTDEIVAGIDELGVLLCGHARGAYWLGSRLSVEEARSLAPYNNATSLQVCGAVLAGMVWAIENPQRGLVEPEEMDFRRCLDVAGPYWGPRHGAFTDWTPLLDRETLFAEDIDRDDPWQFKNIRVL